MEKIGVLVYDYFSLQEITTLTSSLTIWFGEKLDFIGSEKKPYKSEDGFWVTPTKEVSEVDINEYKCLILPGIINPLPALYDEQIISFLRKAKDTDVLIASISASPLLLAKAGLLDKMRFTAGIFMQMLDVFSFIPKENFIHQPVVEDKNIITAIGFAFREFSEAVLKRLGYDPGSNYMMPVNKEYTPEELTYYFEDSDYKEFLQELKEYEK